MSSSLKTLATRILAATTIIVLGSVSVFSAIFALNNRTNMPIMYQGRLTDSSFLPITDAARPMIFQIYDDPTAGTCLWSTGPSDGVINCGAPDSINVDIQGGIFTAALGNADTNNPLIDVDFNSTVYYLDVEVWNGASYETLTPRKQLGGVPYAYESDLVGGHSFDGISGGQTLKGGISSFENLTLTSTADLSKGKIFLGNNSVYNEASGFLGIGNTTPADMLSVGASSQFQVDALGNISTSGTLKVGSNQFFVDTAGNLDRIHNITYSWPSFQGGSSTVLTNDGSGTLDWLPVGGGINTDGSQDTWAGQNTPGTLPGDDTGFGYNTLLNNAVGQRNTAFGSFAMPNNYDGNDNIGIGYHGLGGNFSGSNNIGIGNNAIMIDGASNNNTVVGHEAFQFVSAQPSDDNTVLGYQAMKQAGASPTNSNVAIGERALFNTATSFNTAVGTESLYSNGFSGARNTAVGYQSIYNVGQDSTSTGYQALRGGGSQDTAQGFQALFTGGTYGSTAQGYQALFSADSGGPYNTAQGNLALFSDTSGSNNTAQGNFSMGSNTLGSYNTASGDSALSFNTTGSFNIGIGFQSGIDVNDTSHANTTGTHNIYLGVNAGPDTAAQLDNTTVIGWNALVDASNSMVLGAPVGSGFEVNVGIGTVAPSQRLEVNGGLRLNTATAKPTCDATTEATFWVTQGGAGVKDDVEVCAKDATDTYAWRMLY